MKFSAAVVLTAALGVSAHPSGHHGHAHAHRSLEARREFVVAKKPVEAAPPAPTPVVPVPAPVPTSVVPPVVVPTPSGSTASEGNGPAKYVDFCTQPGKRATLAEIAYKGNVGTNGKYGCNIMLVRKSFAPKYKYTITFTNKSGKDQKGVCFNKIGPDNGINGFFKGNEALDFSIPAGGVQTVAFDANSQGACTFGVGAVPTTSIGQFAGTWLEFDFENTSNRKWSGADASCLVAAANGMDIPPLSVCDASKKCSTVNQNGSGDNAYLGGMEALDGVGLNLAPGPVALTATVG